MSQDPKILGALKWIINLLNRLGVPYQVAGGLAAVCHGSTRPLHDIDMLVPGNSMSKLQIELQSYIEFGPAHHKDETWDLVFMRLNYQGQQIEIADADQTCYFDSQTGQWIKMAVRFAGAEIREFAGVQLQVMPKQQLVEYKRRLNRKVDQTDLKEMSTKANGV